METEPVLNLLCDGKLRATIQHHTYDGDTSTHTHLQPPHSCLYILISNRRGLSPLFLMVAKVLLIHGEIVQCHISRYCSRNQLANNVRWRHCSHHPHTCYPKCKIRSMRRTKKDSPKEKTEKVTKSSSMSRHALGVVYWNSLAPVAF